MKSKMAYFNSRAFFTGIGISLICSISSTDFWISGIIGTILGVIALMLIKKKTENKIINSISGFILASIASIILVNMGHSLYLRETPVFILSIFPIIAAVIISKSGKKPLNMVLHIFFIYSIVLFFLKIAGLYLHINIENLHPLLKSNFKTILWGGILYAIIGIVPILTLNDTFDKKNIILNYVLSSITILVVSFLAVSVLGIKEVNIYRYPEYLVLKRVEFLDFINNVDSFFNFAIITDLLFTMANGIKAVKIDNTFIKILIPTGILAVTVYTCFTNWPLLFLYKNLPIIFIFLLIITLIPKKN